LAGLPSETLKHFCGSVSLHLGARKFTPLTCLPEGLKQETKQL
jgi:hypothetical protein